MFQNDPHKTAVAALFISTVASQMKFGRVAPPIVAAANSVSVSKTVSAKNEFVYPTNPDRTTLSKNETRQLLRDATFGFEGRSSKLTPTTSMNHPFH
jgi:hypothetical protein